MQTGTVTLEHLKISTDMMCQRHRLCFLQMRKSRHKSIQIFFHNTLQYLQQVIYQCVGLFDCLTHVHSHIQSNLIITAASGMEFFAGISDTVDQICLYKAVDIFVF